jgi:hypothetical protein
MSPATKRGSVSRSIRWSQKLDDVGVGARKRIAAVRPSRAKPTIQSTWRSWIGRPGASVRSRT